jgi:hypothetical protein
MIKVTKKINLEQLDQELNGLGLIADLDDDKKIIAVGLADNNTATEVQLKAVIASHVAEPTESEMKAIKRQAIADRIGLTADEVKILLG